MEGHQDAHSAYFNAEMTRNYVAVCRNLKYQVRLLYCKWNRTLGDEQVEEEVDHLIVEIVKAGKNYDPARGGFKAWANAVAMHRLEDRKRDFFREDRRRGGKQGGLESDVAFDLVIELVSVRRAPKPPDERLEILMEELKRIPAKERHAINLRFFEGADYASIARGLRVTEAAARGLVCRGLDRLGKRVQDAMRRVTRFSA
jgi:RNA polymerase sigma-70 factor, ECF subfamily